MSESGINVYYSSVSSNKELKKQQLQIFNILEGKKMDFQKVDVTEDNNLQKMRDLMDDQSALAPQFFNGTKYLGDYAAFDDAVENKNLDDFFKGTA